MMQIELKKSGPNGLDVRYKSFRHVTGNQIKILPFTTKFKSDFTLEFKSFQGIIGELFRIVNKKSKIETIDQNVYFKTELKETILENAINKVETENVEELKRMLSKLFFDEDNGLMKFNIKTLSYMNLSDSNDDVKEVSKFIFEIFLMEDFYKNSFDEDITNQNLLHQLILECLPVLPDSKTKTKSNTYKNLFPEIKEQFNVDLKFLKENNDFFLKHVEDLFKYYYFHYLSQIILRFNNFGNDTGVIKPIHFTLDWETLSETRLSSHSLGWKHLNRYSQSIFAHVNAIELLNYILIDDKPIGEYNQMVLIYESLDSVEKEKFQSCIKEVILFYTESISLNTGSWEECEKLLNLELGRRKFESIIVKDLYTFWYKINYQFDNTKRENADVKYANWFSRFAVVNFTKQRGRLGSTTVLSQELLLFLTRLCIGNEEKIRLKFLWDRFKDRGIVFDETSKLEITKLFEKINLIEKKSDSGDAQYIKSTI
ncbi:DNA phosphorothioation-dependent restriction protein DptG [Flavobacterium yafengii]|uniref:DNA phosphorothioation-dependent restriction protein DptG n=1 Tax=Flavobacterium yafengii TaxID=3041253 RepID=UPI0024A9452F|nr:DNA phosphorothioation-dependent restriction protein DptG [Flavobacterium yafengii]MDI5897660.1 DNA phosphorothioation-dependent restriction protein DptG [Flavobacterium yafengii]